ncbi:MAG: biotin--[acetyl-CoA-carboxylase] ligase [Chitinispirillia bacterium]|nr:biotin--[acetyl-CoA-carboxylase] ligase [Chitinispirillia bacterium]MCL2242012.1 biotin--[acetyl-CoA-carboxylase] ligase [Chitinispirillia bacterium]
MEHQYIYIDSVDSTNNYAKSVKNLSGGQLTVLRAGRQTGGRGRGDHRFFSDHAGGLWASIITPISDISAHFEHNRAISLAILESLKGTAGSSAPITIKWPNDIYWGDRKITGILLENVPDNPDVMVIGFGINVNIGANDFPDYLRGAVTSVLIETGREAPQDRMLEDIVNGYRQYLNSDDQAIVHKIYSGNLYRRGHRATVGSHTGKFITVEIDGRLRLETGHGDVLCSSGTLLFNG